MSTIARDRYELFALRLLINTGTMSGYCDTDCKFTGAKSRSKIVVVAGTNDYSKDDVSVTDALEDALKLIQTARSMADEVVISGVCPRLDTSKDQEHFPAFNAGLPSLCEEKECSFIDHSPSFTFSDGSVNEGFLINKGPHLTRAGSNRLIKNLGLGSGKEDVTKARNNYKRMPAKDNASSRQQRGCYYCSERNHISKNCRLGGPIVCASCKRQ